MRIDKYLINLYICIMLNIYIIFFFIVVYICMKVYVLIMKYIKFVLDDCCIKNLYEIYFLKIICYMYIFI